MCDYCIPVALGGIWSKLLSLWVMVLCYFWLYPPLRLQREPRTWALRCCTKVTPKPRTSTSASLLRTELRWDATLGIYLGFALVTICKILVDEVNNLNFLCDSLFLFILFFLIIFFPSSPSVYFLDLPFPQYFFTFFLFFISHFFYLLFIFFSSFLVMIWVGDAHKNIMALVKIFSQYTVYYNI